MVNGKRVTGSKVTRQVGKKVTGKKSQEKKSRDKKSQYIFSTFTIPRKVTVWIMSDFVHTQIMVFIATFNLFSVIW